MISDNLGHGRINEQIRVNKGASLQHKIIIAKEVGLVLTVGEAIEFTEQGFFRVVGMPLIPKEILNLFISKMLVLPTIQVRFELVHNVGFDGFFGGLEADARNMRCVAPSLSPRSPFPKGFFTTAAP